MIIDALDDCEHGRMDELEALASAGKIAWPENSSCVALCCYVGPADILACYLCERESAISESEESLAISC